ncbi:MAG: tripartite tricarboxylate transporter substrate binding protein [Burkholderiales bacterium]
MKNNIYKQILMVVSGFGVTTAAIAQDYPSRSVRMVVPFAPGGASDFVGRILQSRMTELLGQQVVIDNRAGAAGNIGVELAAKANPDGYTFLLGNVGTMAINANIFTKFPVKPLNELMPITQVVDVSGCLVVHPALPVKNVKELIAYMKANPGKLNYGSPAPSSANNLEMQMFMIATGTNAQQVNYKGGAGPAMIGLLANEVQTMFVTFSSAVTHAKSGRARMLATVSPERIPAMPDVPTMREQGLNMVVGSWQGIYVPKGTPAPVIKRLYDVSQETMKHPDVMKRLGDSGVTIVVSKSSDEFAKFWKSEHDRFAKVIRDAKIPTE